MPDQTVPSNVAPSNNLGLQQPTSQLLPQVSTTDPLSAQQQVVSKATDVQSQQQNAGAMFVNNSISQGIWFFLFFLWKFF